MLLVAWPGNQRALAVYTNVPAQHDDTDFYGDVSASLKISGSRFCYTPPPIPKARTRFGLFHICSIRQPWWDFADSPRERYPFRFSALGPSRPLCSPFFSSGLASVREVTSSIGAGSGAASCGWEVVASGD